MKKKFGVCILSAFLAVIIAVLAPMQVFAATQVEYISEIRIGYGDEGKAELSEAGYTVIDYDVNEGGKGNAVYLGYKKTTVKEDAITDLAVMPMRVNGESPFSFDLYEQEMQNISKQVDKMIENFDDAIQEYRTNLKKPAPQNDFAKLAYEILNQYIEDDSGIGVGDLFAMEKLNDEDTDGSALKAVYHKILMTGNSVVVSAIQTALAIGCTETGGETFLDRLSKETYTGEAEESYNDAINILAQKMSSLHDDTVIAKQVYDAAVSYPEGCVKYVESLDLSAQATALKQISLVEILSSIEYADLTLDGKQLSFLDVALLPTEITAGRVCLTADMLEPLAKAMTKGQIAISRYTSLYILIGNAYVTSFEKTTGNDGVSHYDLSFTDTYLENFKQIGKISVYVGVDRSIFDDKNYHTVAITNDAIRSGALSDSFGTKADYKSSGTYEKIGIAGLGIAAIGGGALFLASTKFGTAVTFPSHEVHGYVDIMKFSTRSNPNVFVGTQRQYEAAVANGQLSKLDVVECTPTGQMANEVVGVEQEAPIYYTTVGTKVTAVLGAIALAAGIALAIYGFVTAIKTSKPQKVEYDPIPRAIVDVRTTGTGEDKYFIYYAARLVGASDDYKNEKDTTKLYGDLNGLSHYEQWACLYYAKDMRIGSPITVSKILVQSDSSLSSLQVSKGYVPIHSFFDNTLIVNNTGYKPINMNEYSTNKNASKIYVFFKRDLKVDPLTSTIMDETVFNWFSITTFFVGAGLAGGGTCAVMKRKKKSTQE